MIVEGPCKPLNEGDDKTVRMIISMGEATRLLEELRLVSTPKHGEIRELISGLEGVKRHERELEIVEAVAEIIRRYADPADMEGSRVIAGTIMRKLEEMRQA